MKKIILFLLISLSQNVWAQNSKDTLEAHQCFDQAMQFYEAAQYGDSREKLVEASNFFEQTEQWPMGVRCQNLIARNFIREGQIDEAQLVLEKVAEEHLHKVAEKDFAHAEWDMIMGEVYLNKGKHDRAQKGFQTALQKYNSFHQNEQMAISSCYNLLAINYLNTGNWDLAFEHQTQALRIRETHFGKDHPETAASYNDMGLVYMGQGNMEEALIYYEKALSIYQKIYPENHPKIANAYVNIAIIDQTEGRYPLALINFEQALSIWKNIYGLNHPLIAFTYSSIGQVYNKLRNFSQAMAFQKDALGIYRATYQDQHPEVATTYSLIGNIYAAQNEFELALQNYQKALQANIPSFKSSDIYRNPPIEGYYNADVLLNTLIFKARTLESQHLEKTLKLRDLETALATLELCDQLIKKIRQLRTSKSDKINLGQTAKEVYEDAIRISITLSEGTLKKQYYLEKAFYFSEQSKAAVLLATILDTQAKSYANIPTSFLNQEKYLKSEIAFYEQKMAEGPSPQEEEKLRSQLFNLNRQYEGFIANLEQDFPQYHTLKYNVKTVKVSEIQKLLGKDSQLISYFIGERNQRLYIFSISPQKIKVYDVAKKADFDKYIVGLRNALQFQAKRTFLESTAFLDRQLFLKAIRPSTKKLIVVPDGKIGTIPFEVLFRQMPEIGEFSYHNLPYLIRQCAISYAYSATLYHQLQNKEVRQTQASDGIFLCAPVTFQNHSLAPLPATEQEVNQLQELFGNKSLETQVFLHQEAREMIIKSNLMKNYRFVHFATHGLVNETRPELSQLYLFGDSLSSDDGNLYTSEIYNLEMDADLVTLSACQTALGKISQGEGIIGLSRALLYAGARNVQVSLWKVADESTSNLMQKFYQKVIENSSSMSFAQALREAKLELLKHPRYTAPYYWAPFILIGR